MEKLQDRLAPVSVNTCVASKNSQEAASTDGKIQAMMADGKHTQLTCLLLSPNSSQLCLGETEEEHHQTEAHAAQEKRPKRQKQK